MAGSISSELDTSDIRNWRSIATLIVFVITNIIVLFPFKIPVWIPTVIYNAFWTSLAGLRIVSPRENGNQDDLGSTTGPSSRAEERTQGTNRFVKMHFPMNFVTAPLIADLFLLAILAIGREEVYDGTVGTDHIFPIDIMAFFISLAYIAISLDASGLIRWLAFKVLQKAGKNGRRLFFYLYSFFFSLASFIGNDPIILSGTPFLAYMTRVSENIRHPKAWIHTQFTLANTGSAVLVTSNPTNLVLAGAFKIRFIVYTANIIVPVVATVILLYPFLLYLLFRNESLIPRSITLRELPEESRNKAPVNPNIPYSKGIPQEDEDDETELAELLHLEEVLNPYLHKWSAGFGAGIMAVTLITILAINASIKNEESVPAYYITVPAAVITFGRDLYSGWRSRKESRKIAQEGKEAIERTKAKAASQEPQQAKGPGTLGRSNSTAINSSTEANFEATLGRMGEVSDGEPKEAVGSQLISSEDETTGLNQCSPHQHINESAPSSANESGTISSQEVDEKVEAPATYKSKGLHGENEHATLVSITKERWMWCRETFPTVTTVLRSLPYPLVPFALCMFVLVQALVSHGWIGVFAYGWSHWISKTGTIGAIGGMAFLSIVFCNFAGTNIGTAILLCRLVQAWVQIHKLNQDPISQRTFWATVYSMAIGLNYGAFSTFFSASLAGLLWRDILRRKHIIVKELDFARVNVSIIAFTTAVACAVLIGEVYIMRKDSPYQASG